MQINTLAHADTHERSKRRKRSAMEEARNGERGKERESRESQRQREVVWIVVLIVSCCRLPHRSKVAPPRSRFLSFTQFSSSRSRFSPIQLELSLSNVCISYPYFSAFSLERIQLVHSRPSMAGTGWTACPLCVHPRVNVFTYKCVCSSDQKTFY